MTKGKGKKPTSKVKKPELIPLRWPLTGTATLWAMLGLIVLGSAIVFWRFLSGQDLFIFEDKGSDAITLFYPNLVHLARYYQEVGYPGWSFFLGLGQAFFPGGLLNPWDWVFVPMDPKTIAFAIGYVQWIKLIASGFIFGLFLKKVGVDNAVVLTGGIIYAFGGYLVVGSGWYIHTTHIFWITVSLLAFEMLLKDQKWWLMPFPFIFLAGTRAYFLVLFFILYVAVRTLDHYDWDYRKLFRVYGRMILCGLLALMLAAPFVASRFYKLYNSPRVTGGVSKVESLVSKPIFETGTDKHNATVILRWFSSDILGTADEYKGYRNYLEGPLFYIGLLTLLLVPQFFWLASKKQRWLYGGLLFVWFWLMLFPWFRYAFYAFAGDYFKGAISLFFPFSVLFVALLGLDMIVKGRKPNLILLSVTLLGLLAALWFPYASVSDGIQSDLQLIISVFLVAEAGVLAMMHTAGFSRYALIVMAGLVAAETGTLSYASYRDRVAIPAADLDKSMHHFDDSNPALDYIKQQPNEPFYRVEKAYGSVKSGFNDALVQGFFGTKMYQSHNNKYYVRFMEEMGIIPKGNQASSRWLVGFAQRNTLHPLASVKYFLANAESRDKVNTNIYEKIHQAGTVEVYKSRYFMRFGIPFTQYFLESDFLTLENSEKLEALYYGIVIPDKDRETVKNMKHGDLKSMNFGGGITSTWNQIASSTMEMTSFTHSRLQGKINIQEPGVVFFSMPYDPSWKVYVDGVEKEIKLVNLGFCGIHVDAGAHAIELKYVPPYSQVGWILFGIALGAFIFLVVRKIKLLPIRA